MQGDELQRLNANAESLLRDNEPFLRGECGAEYLDDDVDEFVKELEYDVDADLQTIEEELRIIKDKYDAEEGSMDSEAAVVVHEYIDLTRAQAADNGIWHDLSIRKFPWFVRHRWSFNNETAMKKKFWTDGTALDSQSCTFERLWWIAELTHNDNLDDPYLYTRQAFQSRRFVFRVFDIKMGRYNPAGYALAKVLYDEDADASDPDEDLSGEFASNDVIDGVVQRFRKSGATMPFEGRRSSELIEAIEAIRENVEGEL